MCDLGLITYNSLRLSIVDKYVSTRQPASLTSASAMTLDRERPTGLSRSKAKRTAKQPVNTDEESPQ